MNILFLNNKMTPHQRPLSEAFYRTLGDEYAFFECERITGKLPAGWSDDLASAFVHRAYEMPKREVQERLDRADVVILGGVPAPFLQGLSLKGKLLVRYTERPFKTEPRRFQYPLRYLKWHFLDPKGKADCLLAASAFAYRDYSRYGLFRGSAYRWGYFPAFLEHDADALMKGKDKTRLLWCGRFLDWKHPDDAIRLAARLDGDRIPFSLDMIGTGPMEADLKRMVQDEGLRDKVRFLGEMKPEAVRRHMEKAGVYLLTSDRREGWGVVLNESMNAGCAVVASHAVGSVPFLLDNGRNGCVYPSGDFDTLCRLARELLRDPALQERLGLAAYQTIAREWNAETAASRVIRLFERLLAGEKNVELFQTGPCSPAELIDDDDD